MAWNVHDKRSEAFKNQVHGSKMKESLYLFQK